MLLLTETDGLRLPVHLFDDGKRLQAIALLTQQATALLLAFLHGDAYACHLATSLTYQVYEGMDSLTVGQEIVDYQHAVRRVQIGPLMSLPRPTRMPSLRNSRMGAMPDATLKFDAGQWATTTPRRFISASSSPSVHTQ